MKKSPYMNINRIEFIVTYDCSGRCKHCSLGDALNRPDGVRHVSAAHAAEAIKELAALFDVTSVMTFGGEPLLYAEVVCAIHGAAAQCGIDARQVITNGYFTKDDRRCGEAVRSLKAAGVNQLLLSVDAFHQESIPLEAVYRFAKHAKDIGIPDVRLSPAWVVSERHGNPYNARTKEILSCFADLELSVGKGNDIVMAGNAALYLAEYYDSPHVDWSDTCGSMPYTEPLTNITSLTLVPNGDVMICGFVIGNIHRQTMREITERYDPYENEWMNALIAGGASGLLGLSRQKGMELDASRCYSVCDLCHTINTQERK